MSASLEYGLKTTVGDRRLHPHRLIAERALGRPLPRKAHVHHVDEDKANHSNTNLVICEDAAYHQLLHIRADVVRIGGDPNTQRVCTRCRQLKDLAGFYERADRPGGLTSWCRDCFSVRHQEHKGPPKVSRLYKLASPETQSRILDMLARGLTQRQVAAAIGVRQCSISAFVLRRKGRP